MQASKNKRPHSPTKEKETKNERPSSPGIANRNKRPHSPSKERTNSPVRDTRKRGTTRDEERPARDSSPVHNKRRREERKEVEKGEKPTRDNRPRYYQPSNPNIPRALMDKENDDKKLASRQKQIDFGKNTIGYQRYTAAIPKTERKRTDIWTPDKYYRCSKRSWDGQIRQWRRLLHEYDPPAAEGEIEIDLDNEDEDISHLEKELEEDREAEDKENNKNEENKRDPEKEKPAKKSKAEIKTEVKTEVKIVVTTEVKTEAKKEEFVFTKLPFLEPLEHESWCDMV